MKDEIKKIIKKECDYHWDSDIEKQIQEQINWWCVCYSKTVRTIDGIEYIPVNIKNDLWRDILTSVFNIHNEMIISKLLIQSKKENEYDR